jgi:cell division protein FtsZ
MFEIHDAAKFITESVDPNAKIIFGTVRDDKLKKGEIKITVIASGFPDSYMKKNLFGDKGEDEAGKGKIFNSVFGKEDKKEKEEEEKKQNIIEDDDEWGAVPAFLRRSKLK